MVFTYFLIKDIFFSHVTCFALTTVLECVLREGNLHCTPRERDWGGEVLPRRSLHSALLPGTYPPPYTPSENPRLSPPGCMPHPSSPRVLSSSANLFLINRADLHWRAASMSLYTEDCLYFP